MWSILLWIREAFKGIFRNFTMNFFSIILSMVCFFVLAFWIVIGVNAQYLSNNLEDKVQISLLLDDEVKDYTEIEKKLKELDSVESYSFISKDEAYKDMENKLGDRSEMLTSLGFNPLPASFQIKLKNPKEIKKTAKIVESWGVSKNVKYGENIIENLFNTTTKIKQIAYIVIVIMGISTSVMLYVSIRVNILNRNKEIEIKDLVGAGMFNIRVPFILETLILTSFSAIITLLIFYLGYERIIDYLMGGMSFGNYVSMSEVMQSMIPTLGVAAVGIGLISGFLSTQKYIKRH